MNLTNDEKTIVVNLLLSYKGLSVAESGTVIGIIQKIQTSLKGSKDKKLSEDTPLSTP